MKFLIFKGKGPFLLKDLKLSPIFTFKFGDLIVVLLSLFVSEMYAVGQTYF
jgi:hypothetical protein